MKRKRQKKGKTRFAILANYQLGFGRHARLPLAKVPRDYLDWILSEEFRGDPATRWIVRQYIAQIGKGINHRPQRPSTKAVNSLKDDSFAANLAGGRELPGRALVDGGVAAAQLLVPPWEGIDEFATYGVGEGTRQMPDGVPG